MAELHRACRYDHGPLEIVPGDFALTSLTTYFVPTRDVQSLANQPRPEKIVRPNGWFFSLHIWRCPACGTIELVDTDRGSSMGVVSQFTGKQGAAS